jgi:hypothetical protein
MNTLTKMVRQKRKAETRVTNDNKKSLINQINAYYKDVDPNIKLSKNATVKEVSRMKKQYLDRLSYDIVTTAVVQGKDIIAEIEGRDLKMSEDFDSKRLGQYAKQLARAKKESDRKLTEGQKEFLEKGNANIKGYGAENLIKLFEKTKSKKGIENLINEVKTQNAKDIYYKKQTELIDRTFQKIEGVREEDLTLLKEKINNMEMKDVTNMSNYLLKTIEVFDYEKFAKESSNETEIANARLDDLLIRNGLKKDGKRKVDTVFKKYKSNFNKTNGFIYE